MKPKEAVIFNTRYRGGRSFGGVSNSLALLYGAAKFFPFSFLSYPDCILTVSSFRSKLNDIHRNIVG